MNQCVPQCRTFIYALVMSFWNILLRPSSSACFTADLHCYYLKLQTQLSVNKVLGSAFMVC